MNEYLSWSAIIAFFIFIAQQIFKTWLDYRKYRYEVVFSKLHQERAETIKELYKKIVLLEYAIRNFLFPEHAGRDLKSESEDSLSQDYFLDKMNQAFADTIDFFVLNKIYLSVDLCRQIEMLVKEYIGVGQNYSNVLIDIKKKGFDMWVKKRLKEKNELREDYQIAISELLKKLENEFRKTLGAK